jgi:AcrR family transcriptional regulator
MPTDKTMLKGQRTRQAILDASYRLFIQRGFAATSMRDISAHAHLALGSTYNHFSSKEDIFKVIVEERHPFFEIIPILNSVQGTTAEAFIHSAAHTLVEQLARHPDFLNLMLIEIVEFKSKHVPKLFARFFPMLLPLAERMSALEGNLRQIPPFVLARAFLGMFFSYYITEILLGQAMPPELRGNAIDQFVEIFLRGILEREPT